MAKRSKFIRLHGASDQTIASVRHRRVDIIIDTGNSRTIVLSGGERVDVYDETDEIIALIDNRKRVKDKHPSRDVDPNPDTR